MKWTLMLFASLVVAGAGEEPEVPYPSQYRAWTHVKSMVIEQGHPLYGPFGGIHHIYANPKAMLGYKDGKFPDGSILVFDLLEVQREESAVTEGKRKFTAVMHRDAQKYPRTGGWGFESFPGDSTTERAVGGNAAAACFGCHEAQVKNGYVFSKYRP